MTGAWNREYRNEIGSCLKHNSRETFTDDVITSMYYTTDNILRAPQKFSAIYTYRP